MAELALGIIGVVDVCIRSGNEIRVVCRRFGAHDKEIEERTVLIEAAWVKIEMQMRYLSRISRLLEEELAKSQLNLLHILKSKLLQASSQLEVEKSSRYLDDNSPKQKFVDYLKKWKWAIKNSLKELVTELEAWQTRFDPTWYLTIRNNNELLDTHLRQLKKELADGQNSRSELPKDRINPLSNMWGLRAASKPGYKAPLYFDLAKLKDPKQVPIAFSNTRAIIRENNGQTKIMVAEEVTTPNGSHGVLNISQIKADVEVLAGKLQQVDTDTFGLLSCKGLVERRDPTSKQMNGIDILYGIPYNSPLPISLRGLLLDSGFMPSLSSILRLAKQLVRSVSFIHTCGFVHKNIRPENVLVFSEVASSFSKSFLVGFNQFRRVNEQTNLLGDPAWHRNLYRHPKRQGTNVLSRYVMKHDIYSLGVCLLEIGLWQSFVHYPGLDPNVPPVSPRSFEIQLSDQDFTVSHLNARVFTKDQLVHIAQRNLPPKVGDLYTEIVLACLTCLDSGNSMFGVGENEDEDGVVVGVRFIEQVLVKINSIIV